MCIISNVICLYSFLFNILGCIDDFVMFLPLSLFFAINYYTIKTLSQLRTNTSSFSVPRPLFPRSLSLFFSFAVSLARRQIHFTHFHNITHMHHMYKHVFSLSFFLSRSLSLFSLSVSFFRVVLSFISEKRMFLTYRQSFVRVYFIRVHASLFRMANIEIVFSFVATNV